MFTGMISLILFRGRSANNTLICASTQLAFALLGSALPAQELFTAREQQLQAASVAAVSAVKSGAIGIGLTPAEAPFALSRRRLTVIRVDRSELGDFDGSSRALDAILSPTDEVLLQINYRDSARLIATLAGQSYRPVAYSKKFVSALNAFDHGDQASCSVVSVVSVPELAYEFLGCQCLDSATKQSVFDLIPANSFAQARFHDRDRIRAIDAIRALSMDVKSSKGGVGNGPG
jgi:hypothetical protein